MSRRGNEAEERSRAVREIIDSAEKAAGLLARLIGDAENVLAFTGAGISTECGVPDFRSPGSPWMTNKPIPFDAFVASAEARREAWRRKFTMDDHYSGARPGRGHRALARWHACGKMPLLVTQNIDGLHEASGIPAEAIIELHGNGGYARCLTCQERHELSDVRSVFEATGDAPGCTACGGLLKSATISFGQAMPTDLMRRAARAANDCDLFLAIGSSLVVHPAASLPLIAAEQGATLIIINGEPTPLDHAATVRISADIGDVLDLTARKLA
jgi:NAD-dependent deacetylase